MVPLTAIVVGTWWLWDRLQEERFASEAEELEKDVEEIEAQIMVIMRERTQSKQRAWGVGMG
jgi:hypothetical protein